ASSVAVEGCPQTEFEIGAGIAAMTSPFQSILFHDPASLLASTEAALEQIPSDILFNDPKYQKLKEQWCAAMLGLGYGKLVTSCQVAVNESDYRMDCDILLRARGRDWDFQLAEVQQPGRRRGLEVKQFADGTIRSIAYSPELGRIRGAAWLADGAERK